MIIITFLLCLMGEICDLGPEEFIVLNFDGPVSYSYKLKDGDTRSYKVENEEEKLSLENRDASKTAQTFAGYIRIVPEGIQLFPGLDKEMKLESGDPLFQDLQVNNYLNNASIHNKTKNDGPISLTDPILISGNFTGLETHRKDFICKKGGAEIIADKKVPFKDCSETKEFNGEMVVTNYSKADLVAKMAGSQNTMVKGVEAAPVELSLKNTSYTPPKEVDQASKKQVPISEPKAAADKPNCSFLPGAVAAGMNWLGFLLLVAVPAGLGVVRVRRS